MSQTPAGVSARATSSLHTPRPVRQVLLVMRTDHAFARRIVQGAVRYGREHSTRRWLYSLRLPGQTDFDPKAYDGVLCSADSSATQELLCASGRPVVAVGNPAAKADWPLVTPDDQAVGRLAGEYLLGQHHTRLAFLGPDAAFAKHRLEGFAAVLRQAHLEPAVFHDRLDPHWLATVAKPAAVFAANDVNGQLAINQCRAAGLEVPDEVAVVGVDNDDLLCETTDPPLSSFTLPHHRCGHEAAALLYRMIAGESVPPRTIFPPGPLVVRRSSDMLAVADPLVRRALDIIRETLSEPTDVAELARAVGTSRRTLESRFRKHLGRTPLAMLHHYRLDRAARLLLETDWPLAKIADQCGYTAVPRLIEAFRRRFGQSPTDYRTPPGGRAKT